MNSIKKQFRSFGYAFRGIYRSLATQAHLQFHAFASCLVVLLAWYLGVSALEWCILVLTIAAVWAAEIINRFSIAQLSPISRAHQRCRRRSRFGAGNWGSSSGRYYLFA